MKNLLRNEWRWFTVVATGLFGGFYLANAATYNFYFNGTEQGDNSTATPTVTVNDDGKSKIPAPQASSGSPTATASPVPPVESAVPVSSAHSEISAEKGQKLKHWAIDLSAVSLWADEQMFDHGTYIERNNYFSGALAIRYSFNKDIGLQIFGGTVQKNFSQSITNTSEDWDGESKVLVVGIRNWYAGAEITLMPFHLSFGKFENLIDLGALAGGSSLVGVNQNNLIAFHGGAKMDVNLTQNWGVQSSVRGNLGFVMASAGLALKF